jgi:hypothetical protein
MGFELDKIVADSNNRKAARIINAIKLENEAYNSRISIINPFEMRIIQEIGSLSMQTVMSYLKSVGVSGEFKGDKDTMVLTIYQPMPETERPKDSKP